jgi:CRISPR system Cascade subunit CasC
MRFLQLHLLTAHAPSNLNRDDANRPKTAVFGGEPRLRISSQSLKRAWRTSAVFAEHLAGHLAERTRRLGRLIVERLAGQGVEPDRAMEIARRIAGSVAAINPETDKDPDFTRQMVMLSPAEKEHAFELADQWAKGASPGRLTAAEVANAPESAADIAMFGRMLADAPNQNVEAAVQVAHALTTHRAVPEDDYYTAVDDLKPNDDDAGAGFLGTLEFAAGVFYLYVCVDMQLLVRNLGANTALARAAVSALVTAAATVAPGGKQNAFANRARAFYVLAERGDQQPRSLAAAFLTPVENNGNHGPDSIAAIEKFRNRLDAAYGPCADGHVALNCLNDDGTLKNVIAFATR